jgi:hypothetical protein
MFVRVASGEWRVASGEWRVWVGSRVPGTGVTGNATKHE